MAIWPGQQVEQSKPKRHLKNLKDSYPGKQVYSRTPKRKASLVQAHEEKQHTTAFPNKILMCLEWKCHNGSKHVVFKRDWIHQSSPKWWTLNQGSGIRWHLGCIDETLGMLLRSPILAKCRLSYNATSTIKAIGFLSKRVAWSVSSFFLWVNLKLESYN